MRRSSLLFDLDNRPTEAFIALLRNVQVPGDDLPSIDAVLQARFFQKNPDGSPKERWELDKVHINCPLERIKEHLAACGFLNKTEPIGYYQGNEYVHRYTRYDYAAWPGALVTRAVIRLNDLIDAWKSGVRWRQTIVFGGKRPLQSDKENLGACCKALGIKEENLLEAAHCNWQSINPQTELDMMKFVLGMQELPDYFAEVIFVDAPMNPPVKEGGPPVRPTTEDTVLEWLRNNPKPGSVLLSSGAPYGMAMDEAFWMLLEPHGFTVETFGHAAPDLPTENLMREIAGTVNRIRRARKA